MPSYNKVLLMGNITRDIEVRHLPSGNAVATIGLAMNRKFKTNDGQLKEEVTFVDCEAFGRTAEVMAQYLSKGKPVFVEGRLKLDTWQDKTDGSNRSKLKIVIESFEFIEGRAGGAEGGGGGGGGGQSAPRSAPRAAAAPARAMRDDGPGYEPIKEDDIPF